MNTGSAAKLRWPCSWSQPRAILLLSGSLWNTPPSRSATVMVSETVYNTDGTVQAVVGRRPRADDFANPGIRTAFLHDRAGRQTAVISNEQGGSLTNPTRDNDLYTRTVYSPTSGLVSQRWRDVNGNGTQDTGDAVTTYSYGTTRGTGGGEGGRPGELGGDGAPRERD